MNTTTVGANNSVKCTATDNAGNPIEKSITYNVIYKWEGFLQPINNTAHQTGTGFSTFKAGSTIPAKFQLKDANGKMVQTTTAPQWLTPAKGSATTQAVEETVYTVTATSGSLFRWDATAQQYIYNWSTKGVANNFYYRIGNKVDDGQTYYQNISLR